MDIADSEARVRRGFEAAYAAACAAAGEAPLPLRPPLLHTPRIARPAPPPPLPPPLPPLALAARAFSPGEGEGAQRAGPPTHGADPFSWPAPADDDAGDAPQAGECWAGEAGAGGAGAGGASQHDDRLPPPQPRTADRSPPRRPPAGRAAAAATAAAAAAAAAAAEAAAAEVCPPPAPAPQPLLPPAPPPAPPTLFGACPICWEGVSTVSSKPELSLCELRPCEHVAHTGCIAPWLAVQNTCPTCRVRVTRTWSARGGVAKVPTRDDLVRSLGHLPDPYEETVCSVCGDGRRADVLLLCDGCDAGFHTHCVQLDRVPRGAWHCRRCRVAGVAGEAAAEEDIDAMLRHPSLDWSELRWASPARPGEAPWQPAPTAGGAGGGAAAGRAADG